MNLKKDEEALSHFNLLIDIFPQKSQAYYNKG